MLVRVECLEMEEYHTEMKARCNGLLWTLPSWPEAGDLTHRLEHISKGPVTSDLGNAASAVRGNLEATLERTNGRFSKIARDHRSIRSTGNGQAFPGSLLSASNDHLATRKIMDVSCSCLVL